MPTRAWASGISVPERRAVDAGMFANCLLDRLAGATRLRWVREPFRSALEQLFRHG